MSKHIQFDIESSEVIEENPDSQFATAKIQAFSSNRNLHDLTCSEEVLIETAPTIYNKPILYTINKMTDDFYTHTEPDKSLICGFVVPDSAEFTRLPDGRLSLNIFAKIWKRYAPKVIDLFKRDSSFKKISVEMEVFELKPISDKLTEMISFAYSGICILGEFFTEASPGANMQMVSFSEENKKYKDAYTKEFSDKYSDIDFTIPESVKSNAKKSLEKYKESGYKANSVFLSVARFLVKNDKITPEKIRQMVKFFGRKVEYDNVTVGFFGGKDGAKWSKSLFDSIDEIDSKRVSYFDTGGENMPYKKVEDMNPSLKGIDPPISLAQGNAIAKQAESIGTDEEKNGWAIAISSFKKSHVVEDGKWVKKEKMSDETNADFEKSDSNKSGDNPKNKEEKEISMADEMKKEHEEEMKETPAEEKVECPEEEKKEKGEGVEMAVESETPEEEKKEDGEEEKFSLNAFIDLAATLAYLQAETDDNEEMAGKLKMAVEEIGKGEFASPPVVMSGMFAAMNRMNAKMSKMMEEMAELKKFKSDIEGQQKMAEVEKTLGEMAEKVVIPDEVMSEMRAGAEKFSFEQLDAWKNECKAKSFDFAVREQKGETHLRIGLPVSTKLPKPQNDVWAGTK